MSATRPANTEMQAGAPPASAAATSRTWSSDRSAVTFTLTPSRVRLWITAVDGSPSVFVTGIFT